VVQQGTANSRPKASLIVAIARGAPRNETPATNTNRKNKLMTCGPNPWLSMGGSSGRRATTL